jgi:hypothetical protein
VTLCVCDGISRFWKRERVNGPLAPRHAGEQVCVCPFVPGPLATAHCTQRDIGSLSERVWACGR